MSDLLLLFYFFFIYGFLGWCLEVVFTVCRQKKLVNKGFLNGPFCPIYGLSGTIVTILFCDITDHPFFIFLGCAIVIAFLEFTTGHLLFWFFHQKWWDYSGEKFNADGYVCAKFTIFWGIFGLTVNLLLDPLIERLLGYFPPLISWAAVIAALGLLGCDLAGTLTVLLRIRFSSRPINAINQSMVSITARLRARISAYVRHRMKKAYPQIDPKARIKKKAPTVFAEGNCFYKLASLFFITAFLGDLGETVFIWLKYGRLVSRSSVVYGPFSVVWGLASVILTACLLRYRKKPVLSIFLIGTALGGTYEYACSVFTERFFGKIFWDYSKLPFNLAGRINLLYCFGWGLVAVVWLKLLYPFLSRLIEKIPIRPGKIICNLLIVFMLFDGLISSAALIRYNARSEGSAAVSVIDTFLDETFPDERMEQIYPFAKNAKKTTSQ